MKAVKLIRRREYLARHLVNFLPYLSIRKVANLSLNLLEYRLKSPEPRSLPPYIKVEPTPLCQLSCPGCMQPKYLAGARSGQAMQMTLDEFKRIVDPLKHVLLGISLSNYGEPLLNRQLAEIIAYGHLNRIAISFPTNLSLKLNEAAIEKLVRSGVDSLMVSLDGASQESYARYRVGGDYELVLANVKAITAAKQALGMKRPRLTWKFVVFDHNRHERDYVVRMHRELGFDDYSFVQDGRGGDFTAAKAAYNAGLRDKNTACYWLWHAMIIRWDGEVFPCCTYHDFHLGNAIQGNSADIWKSRSYQALRRGFARAGGSQGIHKICRQCRGYE